MHLDKYATTLTTIKAITTSPDDEVLKIPRRLLLGKVDLSWPTNRTATRYGFAYMEKVCSVHLTQASESNQAWYHLGGSLYTVRAKAG